MMPMTHALVGVWAVGMNYGTINKKTGWSLKLMSIISIIGSVFPDIDFISRMFGPEYYENSINNIFLSHRGITHSLLGSATLSLLVGLTILIFIKKRSAKQLFYVWLILFAGNTLHIVCDILSPNTVWGGLPVLFPLRAGGNWHRIPCISHIGWYDYVTLYISFIAVIINWIFYKNYRHKTLLSINAFLLVLVVFHISTSEYDSTVDYYLAEAKWTGLQLKRLPDFIVHFTDSMRQGIGYFLFYVLPEMLKMRRLFTGYHHG